MAIKVINNFLSEELYSETQKLSWDTYRSGQNCLFNHKIWQQGIVKDSFPVLVHKIDVNSDFGSRLKVEIEKKTGFTVLSNALMFYYWTRFSYIPWHNDNLDTYKAGFTLYLNKNWHKDFGGYYMFEKDDGEIRAILPQKNMAIIQTEHTQHATSAVNYDGDIRYTVQAFLTDKE
jgi:Rps23 Pro-64 3,4-dihydroxylase Tpa1-like proline 4-hydroxylase